MRRYTRVIARFRSSGISSRRSGIYAIGEREFSSKRTTRYSSPQRSQSTQRRSVLSVVNMRPPITALIHTFNERDYIEDCLRSVAWADEIYLVDSFSTDGTVEFVREKFPRVRIEQREYLGAASQKNYAIDRTQHDWIFYIDADERLTPALREEILRTLEGNLQFWGYSIGRRNFML